MPVNIILFGQIADIAGSSSLTVENMANTQQLIEYLTAAHPSLASAKFTIAVDKKMVKENTVLNNNSTVALLPPFSGG